MTSAAATIRGKFSPAAAITAVVAIALAWSWWPSLHQMAARWSGDPRYSHGFLVPIFAAYLLWGRRKMLVDAASPPSAWGLLLILAGSALGLAGARLYLNWFEGLGPLISLAGLALLAGGWTALKWAGPSIAFLVFMIPLPYRLETALGTPLQGAATTASTYVLQTIGLPAVAEGNIILIDDARIGVVEACNGLGMLLTFFAFSTAVSLLADRSWIDRVLIFLSAAPIAFLANVSRITMTGVLHRYASSKAADAFYHDLAGWLMMPIALIAFGVELKLLSLLFIDPPQADQPAVGLVRGLNPPMPAVPPSTPRRGKS